MKTWVKGGLWGVGIFLILAILSMFSIGICGAGSGKSGICGTIVVIYNLFFAIVFNNVEVLYGVLIYVVIFFVIGAIIGLIISKLWGENVKR